MLQDPHQRKAYQYIRANQTSPIVALRDPVSNKLTADPREMDEILRRSWDKIYAGNSQDHCSTVINYITRYFTHLFCGSQHAVQDIQGDDLYETVQVASTSAPGMDHFHTALLKLLPPHAFHHVAVILNLIEYGASRFCGGFFLLKPSADGQAMAIGITRDRLALRFQ